EHRLDDHLGALQAEELGLGAHARQRRGGVGLAEPLAPHQALEAALHAGLGAAQRALARVEQRDVVARHGARLRDAGPHGAGADDRDPHPSLLSARPRWWSSTQASRVVRIMSATASSSTRCSTKLGSPMLLLATSMQPVRTRRSLPRRNSADASISMESTPRAASVGTSSGPTA